MGSKVIIWIKGNPSGEPALTDAPPFVTALPTLQREDDVSVDHDAQLEDELRSRFEEGLQQAQHGDVSALKHQPPVEVTAGPVAMPTALGTKVESVDVPEGERGLRG